MLVGKAAAALGATPHVPMIFAISGLTVLLLPLTVLPLLFCLYTKQPGFCNPVEVL
jgi:hypothetical protein